MRRRTIYVWGLAILCFVVLMIVTPAIPQSEAYHDFADQREFFGNSSSHFFCLGGFFFFIFQGNKPNLRWKGVCFLFHWWMPTKEENEKLVGNFSRSYFSREKWRVRAFFARYCIFLMVNCDFRCKGVYACWKFYSSWCSGGGIIFLFLVYVWFKSVKALFGSEEQLGKEKKGEI